MLALLEDRDVQLGFVLFHWEKLMKGKGSGGAKVGLKGSARLWWLQGKLLV